MDSNTFVADEMLARPNTFDRFLFDVLGETELPFRNRLQGTQNAGVKTSHTLKLIVDSRLWVASVRRHSRPQLDRSSRWAELRERARKCVATKEHRLYVRSLMVALQQKDLYRSDDVIVVHPHPQPPPPPVTGPRHRPVLLQLSQWSTENWGTLAGDGLFTYEY